MGKRERRQLAVCLGDERIRVVAWEKVAHVGVVAKSSMTRSGGNQRWGGTVGAERGGDRVTSTWSTQALGHVHTAL
jgi:hypothetical protein